MNLLYLFLLLFRRRKGAAYQPRFLRLSLLSSGVLLLLFSLALAACSSPFERPAQSGTPEPNTGSIDTPTSAVSPTTGPAGPTINFQAIGCPSTPSINWDKVVGTKAGVNKVQKVTCGTFENGALAALVNVRYYSSDNKMDFYVYDNLSGTPTKRFEVQGLLGGDAQISPTNSIITAENPDNDPLGSDLFKEYQWNGSTYAQILFQGMYPDMTHYQAEQDQANVNKQLAQTTATPTASGNVWQNSAFAVINKMTQDIFHWSPTSIKNTVLTYNSPSQTYIIQTTNYGPGGGGFTTSLFRLDGVVTNIFEVKQVTSIDGTALLNSPTNGLTQPISSPIRVSGSYQSSGTILGRVAVYNDTFVLVGDTNAIHGSASTGSVSFAPSVSYHLASKGLQEGVVAFYVTNQNNIVTSNQVVLAKVFLSS